MGLAKLNIWVSDVADPCGTLGGREEWWMTILDCKGILEWPCGRFLNPEGEWQPVPNGRYQNLPFRCGHLEIEVPPGCYWALAGLVDVSEEVINFNKTSHVGIAQVGCGETACIKLYNPSVKLCWEWFRVGLRMLAIPRSLPPVEAGRVDEIEGLVEELLQEARLPDLPVERVIRGIFDDLIESAQKSTG